MQRRNMNCLWQRKVQLKQQGNLILFLFFFIAFLKILGGGGVLQSKKEKKKFNMQNRSTFVLSSCCFCILTYINGMDIEILT